jgi:predicted ATP-binding protein involved in virulence
MKIRKLQLKNIGVFDDETIEFQPCPAKDKAEIHIFTGQNGTGKTTILQALVSSFDLNGFDKKNEIVVSKENYERFLFIEDDYDAEFTNSFEKRFKKATSAQISINFEGRKNPVSFASTNGILFDINLPLEISHYSNQIAKKLNYKYRFDFVVFAFSGYRQINSKRVEALYEPKDFNPLDQSLEFVKDYNQENQININQLIANNISKSAIEKGRNKEKSERFTKVLSSIEEIITEITGWKIEFDMQTEPVNLVTKVNGEELEFDVLPDGLRSLISWIADLLGRVDLLKWDNDLPIFEKNLILFLDEIEVHLHPAWQRKVLPIVQKLFKNSQIFVSTHSPFVVNSVDDAWVYKLELENGKAKVANVERSEDARSYRYVLRNTFDIKNEFGIEIEKRLEDFYKKRDAILTGNGNSKKAKAELKKIAKELSKQSKELKTKINFELFQLSEATGEDF